MATQILLVEDDPAVRHLIVQFLTRDGATVHEAETLEQARGILRDRSDISLAILDFFLGCDNAVGLMDDLRADISGAVAFLQKPFRKNDLLAAVASALA